MKEKNSEPAPANAAPGVILLLRFYGLYCRRKSDDNSEDEIYVNKWTNKSVRMTRWPKKSYFEAPTKEWLWEWRPRSWGIPYHRHVVTPGTNLDGGFQVLDQDDLSNNDLMGEVKFNFRGGSAGWQVVLSPSTLTRKKPKWGGIWYRKAPEGTLPRMEMVGDTGRYGALFQLRILPLGAGKKEEGTLVTWNLTQQKYSFVAAGPY